MHDFAITALLAESRALARQADSTERDKERAQRQREEIERDSAKV